LEAGQDRADVVGAAENETDELGVDDVLEAAENEADELAVDDVLEAADETLLPGELPDTLTADMVLLPEAG
jgi:hypothetical protein